MNLEFQSDDSLESAIHLAGNQIEFKEEGGEQKTLTTHRNYFAKAAAHLGLLYDRVTVDGMEYCVRKGADSESLKRSIGKIIEDPDVAVATKARFQQVPPIKQLARDLRPGVVPDPTILALLGVLGNRIGTMENRADAFRHWRQLRPLINMLEQEGRSEALVALLEPIAQGQTGKQSRVFFQALPHLQSAKRQSACFRAFRDVERKISSDPGELQEAVERLEASVSAAYKADPQFHRILCRRLVAIQGQLTNKVEVEFHEGEPRLIVKEVGNRTIAGRMQDEGDEALASGDPDKATAIEGLRERYLHLWDSFPSDLTAPLTKDSFTEEPPPLDLERFQPDFSPAQQEWEEWVQFHLENVDDKEWRDVLSDELITLWAAAPEVEYEDEGAEEEWTDLALDLQELEWKEAAEKEEHEQSLAYLTDGYSDLIKMRNQAIEALHQFQEREEEEVEEAVVDLAKALNELSSRMEQQMKGDDEEATQRVGAHLVALDADRILPAITKGGAGPKGLIDELRALEQVTKERCPQTWPSLHDAMMEFARTLQIAKQFGAGDEVAQLILIDSTRRG